MSKKTVIKKALKHFEFYKKCHGETYFDILPKVRKRFTNFNQNKCQTIASKISKNQAHKHPYFLKNVIKNGKKKKEFFGYNIVKNDYVVHSV